MPSFFLGLILIQVFAISLPIFNFEASQSTNVFVVIGDWYSMTLPIFTLACMSLPPGPGERPISTALNALFRNSM